MTYYKIVMYNRQISSEIGKRLFTGKAIVITGPRQVGKTTLVNELLKNESFLFLDGDDPFVRNTLLNINTASLKTLLKGHKVVFIDECQRIENIGITAKIIVDQIKDIQLILSGSSSFEVNERINEPLTGRKWSFELYPISFHEYNEKYNLLHAMQNLQNRMIYGFYPDILNNPDDQVQLLKELVDSYLFKDILLYANIKKADVLFKLVQALSYQVGSEVSYNELSQLIGIDAKTVSHYIDLLEKAFVVFRLNSYSNNHRNEIKKGVKIYFYDNGVRNAVINGFDALNNRKDIGALWENFLMSERKKQNQYGRKFVTGYFWRTTQHQEIDYIEEGYEEIKAFEFKWNPKAKAKFSTTFTNTYDSINQVVNRDNYLDFVKANTP